jgi:RNA polymerase sigma factor (sigma-70 family)
MLVTAARAVRVPKPEIDDVIQDATVALMSYTDRIGVLADDDELRAVAFCVLRNCWRSRLRNESARAKRESRWRDQPFESSLDPEQMLAAQRALEVGLDSMRRLPEELYDPLVLYYLVGLSAPEVAKRLHLREGTVRSRLRRAVEKLIDEVATLESTCAVAAAIEAALDAQRLALRDQKSTGRTPLDSARNHPRVRPLRRFRVRPN